MISVIIPNYNNEAYIAECLQSILQQTYTDLQIIVVDDGSTDHSVAIMQQFAQQDPRIEIVTQTHAGQSVARNNGIKHVKGEFISFVDSDDYLESDFYETLIQAIGDNDVVQCCFTRITDQSQTKKKRYIFYSFVSAWIRLYRTSFYKKNALQFDEATRYFEDIIFSWDLWALKPKYVFLTDYTGYNYRQNANSITATQKNYQPIYQFLKSQIK
ncbi:MAG: glycosyltransferase, partial [Paludibacteraceae bacterium]|nr:glycosyltransferase [Paludibacteraceae bacterium]